MFRTTRVSEVPLTDVPDSLSLSRSTPSGSPSLIATVVVFPPPPPSTTASRLVNASDAHMALLLDSMSDEQRDRYEVVRRSKLLPSEMKRYLASLGITPPGKQLLIMLGSVAKVIGSALA